MTTSHTSLAVRKFLTLKVSRPVAVTPATGVMKRSSKLCSALSPASAAHFRKDAYVVAISRILCTIRTHDSNGYHVQNIWAKAAETSQVKIVLM